MELIITALSGSFVAVLLHLAELLEHRRPRRHSDERRG